METLSLRLETSLVKRIVQDMKDFHYSTKTEFIREAIRTKCRVLEDERKKSSMQDEHAEKEDVRAPQTLKGIS